MEKKTINEWAKVKGIEVKDPDGFDRSDEKLYERLFTEGEFEQGLLGSTVIVRVKEKPRMELSRKNEGLAANAFRPYTPEGGTIGRNSYVNVLVGDPEGEPYVVRGSEIGWIPINVLIFAASEEDAIERVHSGLRKSKELCISEYSRARWEKLVGLIDTGIWEAELINKQYVSKIDWDDRGLS